jgi:hypothetical protein
MVEHVLRLKELDDTRDDLWNVLDSANSNLEISPGIKKRELFAHIAGWEAIVFAAFREHVYGGPANTYVYPGLDAANADFVAERQSSTPEGVKLEAEINRFAIKAMLSTIPAEKWDIPVRFPWGQETITQWMQGAIDHEREHADEIKRII